MGFKKNVVKLDLCSYPPYILMAPRKFGKTTWWYNLVEEAWGSQDRGLLISCGREEGYHSLDGIQVEEVKEWNAEYDEELDRRGLIQVIDDIIENNDEYKIKGVCFDTLDTFIDVGTNEIFRQHKKEKGTPCKSLNDAFGGFSRGKDRLLDLINKELERLRDAGIAVFFLCHIKLKEKTDMHSGEKYEQITNNLQDAIFTNIADAAQMVMVGVMDREINAGKLVSEDRVIYLRGNSQVDAGGRFTTLPEKISLDPKEFLKAFEMGVKGSIKGEKTEKKINEMKKAENEKREKKAALAKAADLESKKINEDLNFDYIAVIKDKFMDAEDDVKNAVKEIMAEYDIPNFKSTEVSTEGLKKIVDLLK